MKRVSKEEFFNQLNSCEYGRQYLELVNNPENHLGKKDEGDRHHIHLQCLGSKGNFDDTTNVVKLSYFNHCLAHLFLAKAALQLNVIWKHEALLCIAELSRKQYKKLSEIEQITLQEVHHWAELKKQGHKAFHECLKEKYNGHTWNYGIKTGKGGPKGTHLSDKRKKHLKDINSGKIWVTNNIDDKQINPEELNEYKLNGFKEGRKIKGKTNDNYGKHIKGKIWVTNDIDDKQINPEELNEYKLNGFKEGRKIKGKTSSKKGIKTGKHAWNYGIKTGKGGPKGRKHTAEENEKNRLAHLDKEAWNKGKKMPKEFCENMSKLKKGKTYNRAKGKITINNGKDAILIFEEEFEYYHSIGWNKGTLRKRKIKNHNGEIKIVKGYGSKWILPEELDEYILNGWHQKVA